MDAPPSYNAGNAASPPPEKQPPPSYDPSTSNNEAGTSLEWTELAPEQTPTLILDDTHISSSSFPSRPLYELSNAPVLANRPCYGLEKITYKISSAALVKRKHKHHIYDISEEYNSALGNLQIDGQRASRHTHRKVILGGSGVSKSYYKAEGLLKVAPDGDDALVWKREGDGAVMAVEKRGTRDKEGKMVVMPRLEVKLQGMEPKEMDLLVAAWCGRVWQDSKEGLTWKKFKRVAVDGRESFRDSFKKALNNDDDDKTGKRSEKKSWRLGLNWMYAT